MTDLFVDYTNATELEKFTNKLGQLMKEIAEQSKNKESEESVTTKTSEFNCIEREILFRGVDFKLNRFRVESNEILKEIPNFRYDLIISKCFDLNEFWLLECVEKGRIVSEATGRLLLGALIQQSPNMACFVRIGETLKSEKYLGFMKLGTMEYFETFPHTKNDEFKIVSAQIVLEWLPNNLRITFPGFSGYFDSVHPIERIQVRCIWPQIPRDGLNFSRDELQGAPIWIAEYEESDQMAPLRNTMLRTIQAAHLREVLFTPMGDASLISIQASREGKFPKIIDTLELLWIVMAQIYLSETEGLEKDLSFRYNFIPKRVMETMRWERINEAFSLIWRRFIKSVQDSWNGLSVMTIGESCFGEIENSIKLINWCIERELEWQGALKDHVLLRNLCKMPTRYTYNESDKEKEALTVDEKIDKLKDRLELKMEELGEFSDENVVEKDLENEFQDCKIETEIVKSILNHGYDLKDHVVYEPVTLNCEPPPNKIMTKSLLKNPLAGDVIAMNQLREDMRAFKAWNEEICGINCEIDENGVLKIIDLKDEIYSEFFDLGFVGFLLWHSPNDVELINGDIVISQRMRDVEGQWLKFWENKTGEEADDDRISLNKRISFNHRALLGQVISDLTLKTDLKTLLEGATPFLTRKAAELLGNDAENILNEEESRAECSNENYPLDSVNNLLNDYESRTTKSLTLQALCYDIFPSDSEAILVSGERQREFLLNEEHDFKVIRKEIIGKDGEFRELISGYESIRIKLEY